MRRHLASIVAVVLCLALLPTAAQAAPAGAGAAPAAGAHWVTSVLPAAPGVPASPQHVATSVAVGGDGSVDIVRASVTSFGDVTATWSAVLYTMRPGASTASVARVFSSRSARSFPFVVAGRDGSAAVVLPASNGAQVLRRAAGRATWSPLTSIKGLEAVDAGIAKNGTLTVAWADNRSLYARVAGAGADWSPVQKLVTGATSGPLRQEEYSIVDLAVDPSGAASLAFVHNDQASGVPTKRAVVTTRVAGRTTFSSVRSFTTLTSGASQVRVAQAAGKSVVTWGRQSGPGVLARVKASSTGAWGATTTLSGSGVLRGLVGASGGRVDLVLDGGGLRARALGSGSDATWSSMRLVDATTRAGELDLVHRSQAEPLALYSVSGSTGDRQRLARARTDGTAWGPADLPTPSAITWPGAIGGSGTGHAAMVLSPAGGSVVVAVWR